LVTGEVDFDFYYGPAVMDIWVLTAASGSGGASSWQLLVPTGGTPHGRAQASAVYDSRTIRLILHSGRAWRYGWELWGDTYALPNANGMGGLPAWSPLPTAPVARYQHLAGYDPMSNRMIVFGGMTSSGLSNDVWVLTDANGIGSPAWQQLHPAGTPPPPRSLMAGGYDPVSNRLIVQDSDVWVLTYANGLGGTPRWTKLSPFGTPPPPRFHHGASYDPESNRLIVFGGSHSSSLFNNDTWVLTGANGTEGTPQWIAPLPLRDARPGPRRGHVLQYAPGGRLIVAMGDGPTGKLDDAWTAALAGPLAKASILDNDPLPTLSIADASPVVEGNTGSRDAVFTVTVSPPSGQTLRVAYSTAEGTARARVDYGATVDEISIPAGVATATIRVPILGDPFPENTETFTVKLTPTPQAVVVRGEALGTITDDDPTNRIPVPLVSDVSPTAVVPGSPAFDLTVRGGNFVPSSVVHWNGADRVTTFVSSRELTAVISAGDVAVAGTAGITVVSGGPGGGTSNTEHVRVTAPSALLGFRRSELSSGDGPRHLVSADLNGDGHMDLAVANRASGTVSVWLGHGDGTFGSREDYVTAPSPHAIVAADVDADGAVDLAVLHLDSAGTLSILRGNGDGSLAPRRDFPIGHAVGESNAIAVGDYNRDGRVDLAVADRVTRQARILLGFGDATFIVPGYAFSVDHPGSVPTSMVAGDFNGDGRLDLAASLCCGDWTGGVGVFVGTGDGNFGDADWFGGGSSPGGEYARTVNWNHDAHLDVFASQLWRGNGDGTLGLEYFWGGPAVPWGSHATADVNADGNPDLVVPQVDLGQVAVAAGDGVGGFTSVQEFEAGGTPYALIVADFNGDGKPDLAVSNHTSSTVSIFLATPPPTLSAGDVSLMEGDHGSSNAVFTVTLDPPSPALVSVAYATADGTASAGSDYQPVSGTLTFDPGTTTRTITVPVFGDLEFELDETFRVDFTGPAGATLFADHATGTIRNDDTGYALSVSDVTVTEGDAGTTEAVFMVSMALASPQAVTVDYATADETAAAGFDYLPVSGTLTFPPGATALPVSVPVVGDRIDEPDESFSLNLSDAAGALVVDGQGRATIADDDPEPVLSIGDVTVAEGDSVTTALFTVTLSNPSSREVRAVYATADGTALAGTDYLPASATLVFDPGTTARSVGVTVSGDALAEPDETFFVDLSAPVNAAIGDGRAQGTIRDDDTLAGAEITSPIPGSRLAGAVVTFSWSPGVGASRYWLSVGTTPGGTQIYHADQGQALSREVVGLPVDGTPVHVRLWTLLHSDWAFADYAYGSGPGKGFYTVTPCRLVDTRGAEGPLGGPALAAGGDRTFVLAGTCQVPLGATSVSVNLTVAQATSTGSLTLFPGGTAPAASAINYAAGQTRANNGIFRLSPTGEIVVRCRQSTGTVQFILDVNGYFVE
jgi:hypothetical protein